MIRLRKDWKGLLVAYAVVLLVAIIAVSFAMAIMSEFQGVTLVERQRIIKEIPRQYVHNLERVLKDYQSGKIDSNLAIQIILISLQENDGVFVEFNEIDTYNDLLYVHRENHEEMKEQKRYMYEQKALRKMK